MGHSWHFFRAGGVDQVSLRSGADLLALAELDQKLWVALAMPTRDLDLDPRTLDLLDHDHDARIRVSDILAAVEFVRATWHDADVVLEGGDRLPLAAIKDPKMLAAAKRVLADHGRKGADEITLADALDVAKAFAETTLNGDGVIIEATAVDDDTRAAIAEVIASVGSVIDRSGKPGVDQALVDRFFTDVDKLAAWADRPGKDPGIEPLGERTAAAADALAAVRAKLDDYFARGRLVAFDARAVAGLDGHDTDYAALGARILSLGSDEIAGLPIARVEAGKPAPLTGAVNPAWAERLAVFATAAVEPILGRRDTISAAELATVVERLAAFEAWRRDRPVTAVDKLPLERVRALATGPARAELAARIAADTALADEYAQIASVEKLLRFQRDLARVLRNFVNFSDFYARRDGVFQIGTLYLDARACELCVPVVDAGRHAALAGMSAAYLVYCDLTKGSQKKAIAAAFTNGDSDHLMVGRNGVFYDRDGGDWDATITKIVANPLSVRQAFWSPYKKLARMIEEQVGKRASAAEAASEARVGSTATAVANADKVAAPAVPAPAPAPPPARRVDVGTVAAIGVAVGGIGAMIVGLLATFTGLGWWMPFGLLALLMLISGPSMLLAWLRLRQRNLGPILDANGWALNVRARVNVAFGAALTAVAKLPHGARRTLDDPYADRQTPWRLYTFLITVFLLAGTWYVGKLDRWLPGFAKSTSVLGKHAPATPTPTPKE